ncbi:hypothetical protein Bbelb_412230 [Branchiostoma belcheri]|nr:hypothetical protein Bbelb_412230 [Branchiostoma belcheri]
MNGGDDVRSPTPKPHKSTDWSQANGREFPRSGRLAQSGQKASPFPANKIFDDLIKSNLELPISPRRREEHASVQTRLQYMFVSATLCDLTACTTYQTEEQDD